MELSQEEFEELQKLEESLWRPETRFDAKYMDTILAPDFFEFGRSGRIYTRDQTIIDGPAQEINIKLPLENFQIRSICEHVVQVTYVSKVQYDELEVGNRSSIWVKATGGWKLKFHQGTAVRR